MSPAHCPDAKPGRTARSGATGSRGTIATADGGLGVTSEDEPLRFLLALWLAAAIFFAGASLVVAIVLTMARIPVRDGVFFAQFCLPASKFYAAEPAKNDAYLSVCLLTPFLLGGSCHLARYLVGKIPGSRLMLAFRCANIANGLFFVWCLFPIVYCPHPATPTGYPCWLDYKWFFADRPFFTLPRLVILAIGAGLGWFFYGLAPSRKNRNLAAAVVFGSWLLVAITRFYVPVEIDDDWMFTHHLNPLVFALNQVMQGRHYLVQFPHRYGGYVEFLAPILAWFPRRLGTILIFFGALNLVSMGCLLAIVRVLVRSPFQQLLAGWSLLALLAVGLGDNYYQNSLVREFFPALGLFCAILYLRRPGPLGYGLASSLAALAPIWNPDTGLVLWFSWTATLVAREIGERSWRKIGWQIAVQMLLLAGAAAFFVLYLRLIAGSWPDLRLLFTFQVLYGADGYDCLRVLIPDAWVLIVGIYALGLVSVVTAYLRKSVSWRTSALLMMSLMGIGFFPYFMGRAAESNLLNAAYLVPLILGLLFDETRVLIASGQLSPRAWVLLVPLNFLQTWWALLFVLALPFLLQQSSGKLENLNADFSTTSFGKNLAFIQGHTQPKEQLYLLSDHAGLYHYLSDTATDIDLGSTDEFVWAKDVDLLVAAIEARSIPKLLVDRNFFETKIYNDDVYDRLDRAIAQAYRAEASSPGGRITLYIPLGATR